ncbi:MAG TPA: hypothetical protein VGE56_06845 [Rhodocyclaceae bacterium]
MTALARHAEILKLGRVLGAAPEQLEALSKLDASTIRALREKISASLFDADRHLFQRVATATKLVPAAVAGLIAEKALGPLLCARVAGSLPADRAIDIAKRQKTDFLAEVCLQIDPRQVRELIAGMPVQQTVEVAVELARRREYITMGRFVDSLPEPSMRAILKALTDDEALLRIGFFVEDPSQLSAVIDMLPPQRLHHMIELAVQRGAELWPEALALINAIATPQRRMMAAQAAKLGDAEIDRMIELTHANRLWTSLLPVVAEMDDADLQHLGKAKALQNDAVLTEMILAADAAGLWAQLLPLVAQMEAVLLQRMAMIAGKQSQGLLERLNKALQGLAATVKSK